MDHARKRELEEKVYAGERLSRADGIDLYASDDLAWLGRLAHHRRTEGVVAPGEVVPVSAPRGGDRVMFNVNRHLNLTNVCSASCAYCSFQRKPGEKAAYTMRVEEAVAKAVELQGEGLTELHIVNGLHPTLPWRYYPRVLKELKAALPEVNLKAFTATEIQWFEKISGLPADEILQFSERDAAIVVRKVLASAITAVAVSTVSPSRRMTTPVMRAPVRKLPSRRPTVSSASSASRFWICVTAVRCTKRRPVSAPSSHRRCSVPPPS